MYSYARFPIKEELLRERFGYFLTSLELSEVLRYSSVAALRKARQRGHLPIKMIKLPHRRGWFATTLSVAQYLDCLERHQ
jgi:hypothetical protein